MHDQLVEVKKERKELYNKHGEIVWAITNSTYYHIYAIEQLQILCAMMHQKNGSCRECRKRKDKSYVPNV